MERLLRVSRMTALSGALLVVAACAAPAPRTTGPSAAFYLDLSASGSGTLDPLTAIQVPGNADLRLSSLWFVGALTGGGAAAPRLQIVVRAVREDGSRVAWQLGGTGTADGARGLGRRRADDRYAEVLGAEETAPIRAAGIIALEVLVARVTRDEDDGGGRHARPLFGASRVALVPPRSGTAGSSDAMTLELAAWIPVVSDASAPPGESVRRIVVVEQEPAGGLPDRLSAVRRLAASPRDGDVAVVDEAGAPVLGTTAVALALRVEVVDRTDRPPPGHNLHEDGPRRRLDDPLMWRILRDIAAIEAPPAAAAARGDHPPIRPPKRLL